MKLRNPLLQGVVIIIAAMCIAVVANAFAGRTRRLVLPGWYPNATKVPNGVAPASSRPPAPVAPAPAVTTTIATTATTTTAPTTPAPAPPPEVPPATQGRPEAGATPAKPAPAPAKPKPDLSRFTPHPDKPYVEISGEDAAALHDAGVLFLDARRTSVYEDGHIAGARSFSVWESDIDDKVNALYGERSDETAQNKPIVIYCSGGACEDSHMLAQKLWGIQFNNVYVYKDGFPDWQKRGGAVRTGGQP